MATATAKGLYHQALLDVRRELVSQITASDADENVLIAKARDKRIIQSVQASATAAPGPQSKKEKAEQLVTQVLEAVRTDETKVEEFLQLLEECLLGHIATYIRGKLREYARRHEEAGKASAKLEPVRTEDSAFVEAVESCESNSVPQGGTVDNGSTAAQHQMATTDATSGTPFRPLSTGVVVVEQGHTDNLAVDTEAPVSAIADTQPHTDGPPSVTTSTVPVLPEVKRMEQENKDLQAQLAQKTSNEDCLKKELKRVQNEKEESEKKLAQTKMELETVKKEKESQIQALKAKIEELQSERESQNQKNAAEKEKYEGEIAMLKQKLKEEKIKYNQDKLSLTREIHALELKIEQMKTREKEMELQISEEEKKILIEKGKCAKLQVEVAEGKQKNAEMQAEATKASSQRRVDELEREVVKIRLEHRNSIDENEQLKEELSTLRKKEFETNPDTS